MRLKESLILLPHCFIWRAVVRESFAFLALRTIGRSIVEAKPAPGEKTGRNAPWRSSVRMRMDYVKFSYCRRQIRMLCQQPDWPEALNGRSEDCIEH